MGIKLCLDLQNDKCDIIEILRQLSTSVNTVNILLSIKSSLYGYSYTAVIMHRAQLRIT